MPGTTSIRTSLLRGQILIIAVLSGALLATTWVGAERAVRQLSRETIGSGVARVEAELHRFFDPVSQGLETACLWYSAGVTNPEITRLWGRLLIPTLQQTDQIVAVEGRTETEVLFGLRRGENGGWRSQDPPTAGAEPARAAPAPSWLRAALERARNAPEAAFADRIHWTPPHRSREGDGQVMTAAAGCRVDGSPDAAIAFEIVLRNLTSFVETIDVSPNASIAVMTTDANQDLRIIALAARGIYPDDRSWLLRTPDELGTPLVDDALVALRARAPSQITEALRFRSDNAVWWFQVRPYPLTPDHPLLFSVMVPHADLLGDRNRVLLALLVLTLIAIGAAVIRAATLARRFSRPIEALVRDSERMARGDLERDEPVTTRLAEVLQLTNAHHRMRRGLRSLMKLERDLQLARQIQQGTLPASLPELPGFELAAWSEPAEETGGDSYDVIPITPRGTDDPALTPNRAVLLLADASGHGIAPALCVTELRAMLRMAVRTGTELERLVRHLNQQLWSDLPRNRFITAWLGELDSDNATLTWISAGQGPLLWFHRSTGEIEHLIATTHPLGIFEHLAVAVPLVSSLEPGDVFVVLSDGFFEAADGAGEELGAARIAEAIASTHSGSAEEIVEALRAVARGWTANAPLSDDCTALVIKRELRGPHRSRAASEG